jgi:hypothetical protein
MSTFTIISASARRRVRLATLLGAVAFLVAIVNPVAAAGLDIHGTATIPFSDPGPIPDACRPGITGSVAGTDVYTWHNVRGDNVWHVNLIIDETATLSWSDGSYTLDASTQHITWDRLSGWFTYTQQDAGNTYAADGQFLFRTTFKVVQRAFLSLDGGGVLTKFEKVFTNAFGGCPALG